MPHMFDRLGKVPELPRGLPRDGQDDIICPVFGPFLDSDIHGGKYPEVVFWNARPQIPLHELVGTQADMHNLFAKDLTEDGGDLNQSARQYLIPAPVDPMVTIIINKE